MLTYEHAIKLYDLQFVKQGGDRPECDWNEVFFFQSIHNLRHIGLVLVDWLYRQFNENGYHVLRKALRT